MNGLTRMWGRKLGLIVPAIMIGCGTTELEVGSSERIQINNDKQGLSSRIERAGYPVEIERLRAIDPARRDLTLTLEASVSPPEIDGVLLQANCIALDGRRAIVGYNMQGDSHLGGIDVFDISNDSEPELISQALFTDSDINCVSVEDEYVYLAEATSDPEFPAKAALERLKLSDDDRLTLAENARFPLPSHAGTGVYAMEGSVFATSGDGGALTVVDRALENLQQQFDLHDARWVHCKNDRIVVAQGTPGTLSVFDESSLTFRESHDFPGADIAESKSTVEVVGNRAFVAAGPAGVQILKVDSGAIVAQIPRPDPEELGLDPELVVTNAVAVDDDLIFISNGAAGVYVAQADDDLAGAARIDEIEIVGRLRFDDLVSVNHVEYKDGILIVAGGLGGLKIVRVD